MAFLAPESCWELVVDGRRLHPQFIVRSVPAATLQDCFKECEDVLFNCETIAFGYYCHSIIYNSKIYNWNNYFKKGRIGCATRAVIWATGIPTVWVSNRNQPIPSSRQRSVFTADTVATLNDAATATAPVLTVPINPLLTTVSTASPIDPALLKLSSQKTVRIEFIKNQWYFVRWTQILKGCRPHGWRPEDDWQ